jgi:TonB family protein
MAFTLSAVKNHEPEQVFRDIRDAAGKVLFRIQVEKLERLESLVREGIAEDGVEVGGLVIAPRPSASDPIEKLADFVPVEISYPFGPLYRPRIAHKLSFDEVVSRYPADGELRVAGYFRSHLADSEIREEDRWIMQRLFGVGGGLLVLIHAGTFRWSVLHIYRRNGKGELVKLQEIPVPEILQTGPPLNGSRIAAEIPSHAASSPVAQTAIPEPQKALWGGIALKGVAPEKQNTVLVAGILVLLLATFAIGRITAPRTQAPAVPIGLSTQAHGDQVELQWNPDSPLVKNAVRASLVIVDSEDADRVDLSGAQLAAGKYEYKPRGANVTFQIMFHQRDDTFAGETRSFHAKISGMQAPVADRALVTKLDAVVNLPVAPRPAAPVVTQPATNARQAAFVPPPRPRIARAAIDAPDLTVANESPPALREQPLPRGAPPPNLIFSPPPPPAAPIRTSEPQRAPATAVAPASPIKTSSFSAPEPIKKVTPATPVDLRTLVRGQVVTISVVVDIDPQGKVTNARTTDDKGPIEKILAREALRAVRAWEFKPALRDGAPVMSQMSVQFRFTK